MVNRFVAAIAIVVLVIATVFAAGIVTYFLSQRNRNVSTGGEQRVRSRYEAIPSNATKITPQSDLFPPILQSNEWEAPIPVPGPVNTAGAEDSPFITPDDRWLFFFFTPDLNLPAEKQIADGVTGIYWSQRAGNNWTDPQRIILGSYESLDGCEFVQGNVMWFCSVRAGNYRAVDVYTAQYVNGIWTNVTNAGRQLNSGYAIGEFCLSPDGNTLYFSSNGTGGFGGRDIWYTTKSKGGWTAPINLGPVVNGNHDEDQPFITLNGQELWFTGTSRLGYPGPAVFRSIKLPDGSWAQPQEIISRFAGEPTLDDQGNIYFVHHYLTKDMKLIEVDIYVAYHKPAPSRPGGSEVSRQQMTVWDSLRSLNVRTPSKFLRAAGLPTTR
jgi:hypothetical protein